MRSIPESIVEKVAAGQRLTRAEGVQLLREGDLLELGLLADQVRERLHPERVVTYIIDRNINYTNVCNAQCAFCAFYRDLPSSEGYVLTKEEFRQKIDETMELGGRQVLLQGGLHPDLGIEYYEQLFSWMKATWPELWIHGLARGPRGRAPRPDPGDAPVGDRDGPVAQGTSGHGHDPPGPEKRHSASEVAAACWAGSSGAGCDPQ